MHIYLTREEIEHPYADIRTMLEDKRRKAEQMSNTVFQQITVSPEVLAEKLVYQILDDNGEILFMSTIANVYCSGWQKYEDAYEWTLAKLKKVAKLKEMSK